MLKPFIFHIILIFLPALLQGQHPVVRNYSVEDGLPSSEVYHVIQDRHGYIWFSTDNGVSRFNGYEFENFDVQDGLPDNTILEMYEDYKGRIWFVSLSNKLSYFWNDSIYHYKYLKELRDNLLDIDLPRKLGFYIDTNEVVYYSPQSTKALKIDALGNVRYFDQDEDELVFMLKELGDGKVLWSNLRKDSDPRQDSFRLIQELKSKDFAFEEVAYIYRSVAMHHNGIVYFSLKDRLYKVKEGEIYSVKLDTEPHWISHDGKNLWLGTPNGAYQVITKTFEIKNRFLKHCSVTSVFKDREGSFWFSTLKNGIYYMPNMQIKNLQSILPSKRIYRLAASKNKILMGYDTAAFSVISRSMKVKHYFLPDRSFSRIMDMEYSKQRNIFLLGSANRVYSFDENIISDYTRTVLFDFNCKEIEPVDTGVFLGSGYGLFFWEPENEENSNTKSIIKLLKKRTLALLSDNGVLWVGSIDGLYKLSNNRITYLGEEDERLRNRIDDIDVLDPNTLVLATKGAGLLIYDKKSNDIKEITKHNTKLPSNSIESIIIRNSSELWGASNQGAFKLTIKDKIKEKYNITVFSSYNGLPTREVNDLLLCDSTMYFATNKGLSYIVRKQLSGNSIPPFVYLKSLTINGHKERLSDKRKLEADENTLTFEYIGLSYRKAGNLNYKFRMLGLDSTWISTKQRIQRFTTLDPGRYSFEVLAQNEDGVWSSEPAVYSFRIKKPFYQQWWFLLLAFMLFFASFWIIYKRRINALRKRNILLQSINSYKQRILSQQMNPHFIFNTLNSIQYYLLDEDINASLHYLSQFAKLMRQVLDNSQRDKVTIEEELDALRLYLELESLRFEENLEYKITVDKKINTFEWKILPLLLQPYVENSIKHGLLHKKGKGVISIELNLVGEKIQCIIEDNGVGRAYTMNKSQNGRAHHVSWGAKISSDRIALLNSLYGDDIKVIYTDLKDENGRPSGTRVEILIPILV